MRNFTLSEMDCHDGSPVPAEYEANAKEVLRRLQIVRDFFGNRPIKINSGYRTPTHNLRERGSPNSQHLTASAADFTVKGYSPAQVRDAIEGLIRVGALPEGGLGTYITFVHIDIRPARARWKG